MAETKYDHAIKFSDGSYHTDRFTAAPHQMLTFTKEEAARKINGNPIFSGATVVQIS